MIKPNLFVAGAARSGTTSLWQYLKMHPAVFMPADELQKEPSFFSTDVRPKLSLDSYLALFQDASPAQAWIGEASVAYLTDPASARRIYDFNPSAKVIIILRNPARRAFSLYNWMVQDGYEYASSFQLALQLEDVRLNREIPNWLEPNYRWGYLYFQSGLYCNQVRRYLDLFADNVLLLRYGDLVAAPEQVCQQVYAFLGLPETPFPARRHNPSHSVRSAKIQFILRKLNNHIIMQNRHGVPLRQIANELDNIYDETVNRLAPAAILGIIEKILGKIMLLRLRRYLLNHPQQNFFQLTVVKTGRDHLMQFGCKPGPPPVLDYEVMQRLLQRYAPDIRELSGLTGKDWSSWLNGQE